MIETVVAIILLLCGLVFTVKLKFWKPSVVMRTMATPFLCRADRKNVGISPFRGLCTALGGCIGTGNIIGVTACIALGGLGSIFWIWFCAFLSLGTKYTEVYLSVAASEKSKTEGGGPMQYITYFLGKAYAPIAVLWSILCLLSAVCTGSTVQANAISEAIVTLLPSESNFIKARLICGAILFIITFIILTGGLKRISSFAGALVPMMCVLYLAACIFCIVVSGKDVLNIISSIVSEAFRPSAFVSGGVTYTILRAMRLGVSRGIFSNEAGMGTSTLALSSTSSKDPHAQGAMGMIEIVIDTFLTCTATAFLVIACVPEKILYNAELSPVYIVKYAFSTALGDSFGAIFLSVCIILFAFTSILGWSFYGLACSDYLFKSKKRIFRRIYYVVFCLMLIGGCLFPLGLIWDFAATFNMVLALPNVFALIMVSRRNNGASGKKKRYAKY